tara:strand:- start:532 stop:681 length:150 start_codon:yes stop_codon:yes gene_type:complete
VSRHSPCGDGVLECFEANSIEEAERLGNSGANEREPWERYKAEIAGKSG